MTAQEDTPQNRLDRIEQSIENLSATLNSMATEFIRPLVQQSVVTQNALNGLIQMTVDAEVEHAEQNQRIENMLNDAREDRQRMQQFQEESTRRFDAQMEVLRSHRLDLIHLNQRMNDIEEAS